MTVDLTSRLKDRVALITGAARNIGQAYALRLAAEGADIVVVDKLDGSATVGKVEALGRSALAIQMDVSDEDQVADMVTQATERFGPHRYPHQQRRYVAGAAPDYPV